MQKTINYLWRNRGFLMSLILILNAITAVAQNNTTQTMEELKLKSKQELIQKAFEILKEKQPSLRIDSNDFESSAWGNSAERIVKFRRIIQYIPLGTNPEDKISYDVNVNLNTNEISPFDDTFKSEFYVETEEDKKALVFIKKHFGPLSSDFENIIYEGEEDYFINSDSEQSFGRYVLNKKTGLQGASIQSSYESNPKPNSTEDLDPLMEIKE